MILPERANTRSGEPVTSIGEHKGLIRGTVVTGERQVVRLYLPPDSGFTAEECLSKLIELLDGPGVFVGSEG